MKKQGSRYSNADFPASLKDNPYLFDEGTYETSLLSLPENQRQLLEGDWAVADGAAFPEFSETPCYWTLRYSTWLAEI